MGWSGGSAIAEDVWKLVRGYVPESQRQEIALAIIDRFESEDCDTMDEAEQLQEDANYEDEKCRHLCPNKAEGCFDCQYNPERLSIQN